MTDLFDTHAHLDDEQFELCRGEVIARASEVGVSRILTVGTSAASSESSVQIAHQFPCVFAAVGIQPNYAGAATDDEWDRIRGLVDDPRVRAIGETGLDAHWDYTPWDVQQRWFDRHLRLAQATGLPLVIHLRDCDTPMLDMLRAARGRGPLRGIMHSFTGSPETAWECLQLGLHISFAGMVTFKSAQALRDLAREVPPERLLLETDSPYLAPHPCRGTRPNEPALLLHTARCIAAARGVADEELVELTTRNARDLLSV